MDNPYKVSELTATVTVAGILSGDDPGIRVIYQTVGRNKAARAMLRQIPVTDSRLFARVQAELHPGDTIEITAVNEWYDDGYATHLTDFKKFDDPELESVAKNGTVNIVRNDTSQVAPPPVRDAKPTIRH